MATYPDVVKEEIRSLRQRGYTYPEIQTRVGMVIPKPTLSYMCKGVVISESGRKRLAEILRKNQDAARLKATKVDREQLAQKIRGYRHKNEHLGNEMFKCQSQLIALAMLYLGEGAKWQNSRMPKLASTNPRIICLYIDLLNACYGIGVDIMRARVQCRADQDPEGLIRHWASITGIDGSRFYP